MRELNLQIDASKCIRCGLCLQECAPKSLVFSADLRPKFGKDGEQKCTRCQHCLAVCPAGALSICGRDPADSGKVESLPAPEEVLHLMQSRRSIRSYRKENLEPELVDKLLAMLAWVPTGVNDHRLHVSVIREIGVMNDLRNRVNAEFQKLMTQDPVPPAGQLMLRYRSQIEAGSDVIFRGAPHLIAISAPKDAPCPERDVVIALSYFELYAHSLGIGTCWCGLAAAALKALPEIYSRLEIPEGYELGYTMLFGPTDRHYQRLTQPEPVPVTVVK